MNRGLKNLPLLGLVVVFGAWWFTTAPSSAPIMTAETPEKTQEVKANPTPAAKPAPTVKKVTPEGGDSHFCPVFSSGIARGAQDTGNIPEWAHGNVGTLQMFLAKRYGLDMKLFVDGIFGVNTESYLIRYQGEVGLAPSGVVDATTRQKMLSPCVENAAVNGKAFPKRGVSFTGGSIIVGIQLHETIQSPQGTIEQGAFRIELMSLDGKATLRVTGRAIDGVHTQTISLAKGEKKLTENWPVGLMIELQTLTSSDATFAISQQPTD